MNNSIDNFLPIEESDSSEEALLDSAKKSIRKGSYWSIAIGLIIILLHVAFFIYERSLDSEPVIGFSIFFRSIFFILAATSVLGGIWGLFEAKRLQLADMIRTEEEIETLKNIEASKPYFTYLIIGAVVLAFIVQSIVGLDEAKLIAALVKPQVWKGEFWRLFTSGFMHGNFIHIYLNMSVLFSFGKQIEFLCGKSHVPIVFLISIFLGSVFSTLLVADTSLGASGGVLGLFGFLGVFAFYNQKQLPRNFFKNILTNVAFIAIFGIIGFQTIDNAAHLGGLLAGGSYGYLLFSSRAHWQGKGESNIFKALGYAASGVIVLIVIFTIYKFTSG